MNPPIGPHRRISVERNSPQIASISRDAVADKTCPNTNYPFNDSRRPKNLSRNIPIKYLMNMKAQVSTRKPAYKRHRPFKWNHILQLPK